MSINTNIEKTQVYGLQSAPDFIHWINSNLSRSMIYTGLVVFAFFSYYQNIIIMNYNIDYS